MFENKNNKKIWILHKKIERKSKRGNEGKIENKTKNKMVKKKSLNRKKKEIKMRKNRFGKKAKIKMYKF